jgi:Xaa-Pro aminopeptidase
VPSEDQHASEYIATCDARRAYISGFTGSAGLAIITATGKAQLFTDGRYFLQASRQLDDNWELQKQGIKGVPTWQEYLEKVGFLQISNFSPVIQPSDLACGFWE